ncbi:peptidyl-prolyl cis-trans isomerase C/foldase protein PrsA [Orenia metallireducens]|uniref:Peptidyl-prolyl cis-trans isomerase C/foldase protein PrsA n=1 Tax=Orenia metallireducens TaxID=1413210 RepID=A0A285HCS8_9FIRM|nr:peptidylprolyl isomerase [Orenia metallireducens]PRX27697.1 peptidyl-prolyl cis-trans isomerase C/foldase protein PrsA [Orenia metallireducens]SNY33477.1 peptidyl-prolyl cis-trans isomerase C/foldase protein PrsA [Orenia metallireducens]
MKFKISLILMALLLLISSIAIGAKEDNDNNLVATVNGEGITEAQLNQFTNIQQLYRELAQANRDFAQLLFSSDEGKELLNEYRKQKLNSLVNMKMLEIEAKNQEITISEDEKNSMLNNKIDSIKKQNQLTEEQLVDALNSKGINSIEEFKKMIWQDNKDEILIQKLQQEVVDGVVITEEEVENYYEENKSKFKRPARVKARHILVTTDDKTDQEAKAKAKEVINKLKEGADFATLAKEYSEGPSAENGGDLGYFSKGQMVPAFEQAAFNLQVDEISEPVKTKFGYHIIKVEDKQEAEIVSLADAKEKIKNLLTQQAQQAKWNSFVKGLKEDTKVDIRL